MDLSERDLHAMVEAMLDRAKSAPFSAVVHVGPIMDWLEENGVKTAKLREVLSKKVTAIIAETATEALGALWRSKDLHCQCCRQNRRDDKDELQRCSACIEVGYVRGRRGWRILGGYDG